MKSLIICGHTGAGKTTLVRYLAKHGWKIVSAGEVFTSIALSNKVKNSRYDIQRFAIKYFDQHGYDVFTKMLLESANNEENVVFEGIRPIQVIHGIKEKIPHAKILFIEAHPHQRKERLMSRDSISKNKLLSLQRHPIEQDLELVRNMADYVVVNNSTINALINKFKRIDLST